MRGEEISWIDISCIYHRIDSSVFGIRSQIVRRTLVKSIVYIAQSSLEFHTVCFDGNFEYTVSRLKADSVPCLARFSYTVFLHYDTRG